LPPLRQHESLVGDEVGTSVGGVVGLSVACTTRGGARIASRRITESDISTLDIEVVRGPLPILLLKIIIVQGKFRTKNCCVPVNVQ